MPPTVVFPSAAAAVSIAVAIAAAFLFGPGASSASAQQEKPAPAVPALAASETDRLLALEGEIVRVTGRIESIGTSKSGNQFLNFVGSQFVAVTFSSDLSKFPDGAPAEIYDGKTVAITGPIKIYKGIPEIILNQPSRIEIIDPSALVVPPEPEPVPEPKEEEAPAEPAPATAPEPPAAEPSLPAKTPPVDWRKYFPE